MAKFAVILQAQPGDMGRTVLGLLYSKDLNEAGHQVNLIFDGAYCAQAFNVQATFAEQGFHFVADSAAIR